MSVSPSGAAQAAEISVICTVSMKEALIDLAPAFERASGHKVEMIYGSGPDLSKRIAAGMQADIFLGPDDFSQPLMKQGALAAGSRVALALSRTALGLRASEPKPDITTPDKLKAVLLAAKGVSYSGGASGIQFVQILEKLGIADAMKAKFVAAKPGELIGRVVMRNEADIGVQQISELLPVEGIQIVDLPKEYQQNIVYGATQFPRALQSAPVQAFIRFLQSEPAKAVLRKKGLDPA